MTIYHKKQPDTNPAPPLGVTSLAWFALCAHAEVHARQARATAPLRVEPADDEQPRPLKPLIASLAIKPKINPRRFMWDVVVRRGKGKAYTTLYGQSDIYQVHAHERAELDALLAALDWLRHKDASERCSIYVSPTIYSLLFGSKTLPKLDDVVREIRHTHMALKAQVVIEPDRARLDHGRVLPFAPILQLVPPEKPYPDGGLRRAA